MKLLVPALAAFALGACAQGDNNNTAADDELMTDEAMINDPATTDLNMDSSPTAVDQAINQTDQQSDLGNVAEDAANSVSNTVE